MRAQGLNGIRMRQVGIAVARADDDDSQALRIAAARWQLRRGQAVVADVPGGQEKRHLALQTRLEANILFERRRRGGFVGRHRLYLSHGRNISRPHAASDWIPDPPRSPYKTKFSRPDYRKRISCHHLNSLQG
jgi:hypothetical protein